MALSDAGLDEHSPSLFPIGAVFPVAVRAEVQVGVQVDKVQPAHAAVGGSGNDTGDVDVAVLEVFERFLVVGRDGQREHGAIRKDGLGQPPDLESKPLRLMISFLGFNVLRPAFNCAPE